MTAIQDSREQIPLDDTIDTTDVDATEAEA